ncbi:expressed unknown protein [Ectocarpus siliculosus]|uniref:Uncharacterized protein n=1 Tax=Ectocarpus siliculosus TaxID=2880 RepID=D7G563_ECTSI|nr:expressed unknown protein [Ectocarpus siliculosus]|eukprot:CBJ27217.1 expressed unknown protein [Ectocarpus siliculosus]
MAHTTPRISNLLQIVLYQQNVTLVAMFFRLLLGLDQMLGLRPNEGFCSGCLPPSW